MYIVFGAKSQISIAYFFTKVGFCLRSNFVFVTVSAVVGNFIVYLPNISFEKLLLLSF